MRPKKYISIIFFSVILLGAICFVIFFKIYFVKGDSMSPTLKEGHAVLLLRNVDYDDLQVGDLIVFHSDEYGDCIKRIAAVSGDSIKQKNSELYINNVLKYQYATDKKAEYLVGDTTTEPTESTIYQPLAEYINANTSSMGRIIEKVFESDVNQDGSPDLCVAVIYGSGIISSAIVVYDVQNDKGYILDERMSYDYTILGASEYVVAVCRTPYGKDAKKNGTLAIEGDALVFVENEEVGATLPTRNG